MNDTDHKNLLDALLDHKGFAMISGYNNELYNKKLQSWSKYAIPTTAEKGVPRTEYLWCNWPDEMSLFKGSA